MFGQAERLQEFNKLKKASLERENDIPIVAFTSGKGGTGKTFLTLNLAYALSQRGQRILAVDLDANLSNLNVMLNVTPIHSLYNFLSNQCLINEVIHKFDVNLHFIFGDSGKSDHPKLSESNIRYLIQNLKSISHDYDFIILDTGSGAGDEVLSLLSWVDRTVLIANPEPTSVMDAYAILKLLSINSIRNKKYILLNKCANPNEGRNAFNNLNNASLHFLQERLYLLGIIEYSADVNRSIMNQNILVKKNSNTKIMREITALAYNFVKIKHVVNNNQ